MPFKTKWRNPSGCEYICLGCDRDCRLYLNGTDRILPTQTCDGSKEGGEEVCGSIEGQIPEPFD
jgi:hypothetical protein